MVKTRAEFETLLKTLNIQVFYNHTTQDDVVDTPYIVYLDMGSSNMFADNQTYGEIMDYSVIIHSAERNVNIENQLKELLTNNHIPYEISDIRWNEDILLWTIQFDITL